MAVTMPANTIELGFGLVLVALAGCGGNGTPLSMDSGLADSAAEPVADRADAMAAGPVASGLDAAPATGDLPAEPRATDATTLEAPPAAASRFPDTTATIAVLADQLPNLNAAQTQFAATHYVGSQKLLLGATHALRAINPSFVVLHYHLAMWQSAPTTSFIVDGLTWGNDYPAVTTHESWFWHNAGGDRVPSSADGKLLMNVSDPGFAAYWASSIASQTQAGEYDGVFLDSASPALLQGECSGADPRLAGTAARTQAFSELGGLTWTAAWEAWIGALNDSLANASIPLIPNTSAFVTTWDTTDYTHTAGIFVEGFADPNFSVTDWKASTNQILAIANAGKIVILQNYLSAPNDLVRRQYYLVNYLLVKGSRTYLFYFADSTLEWYPEWQLDLGVASAAASSIDVLAWQGVYRRDYASGIVLLNPATSPVTVTLETPMRRVDPQGGGAIAANGTASGTITTSTVSTVTLGAGSGLVLLK
jgi:hypothetical protein